jgi:hypothetical protein
MTDHNDPEALLRFSIYFALPQYRYAPPKTHDATARDAYFGRVADKVMEQIKMSGWKIERQTLQKHPPIK